MRLLKSLLGRNNSLIVFVSLCEPYCFFGSHEDMKMSLFTASYRYADDVLLFVTLNLVQGLSCHTTGGCGGEWTLNQVQGDG